MRTKNLVVLFLLPLLLIAGLASAAEMRRRVTLTGGEVLEGMVVERGEAHIILLLDDGSARELLLTAIDKVEVLGVLAPTPAPPPVMAPPPAPEPAGVADDAELFNVADLSMAQLDHRLEIGNDLHALAVAPTIPLMVGGMVMTAFTLPMSYELEAFVPSFVLGSSMTLGSVVPAALGSWMAMRNAGMKFPNPRWTAGLVMAVAGGAGYTALMGLEASFLRGDLYDDTGFSYTAALGLIGGSIAVQILGNTMLMGEAKRALRVLEREDMRRGRRYADAGGPQLAALWLQPGATGGISGGFALSF